ncbi:MAG TPA: tyrosine-type recombinase/integrase [Rhizomicrobium sp.]|jgi:integrase|nr:tyrosine-type recombinase/integrase [Rhizomicrobium sp.]
MGVSRLPPGIYRHGAGYRAAVSQGRHRPKLYRQFPKDTKLSVMVAWRKAAQAKTHVQRSERATRGMFKADAETYLKAVRAMPSYKDRERQIQAWVAVFKKRQRDRITSADIRTQRDAWLMAPRGDKPPLAPHTVNLRLRALSNLYTVLDGSRAHNPVRDVEEAPEPSAVPRELDYATIQRIFDEVLDWGATQTKNAGHPRKERSVTKIRLRILAYTGLPASQLKRVEPGDVDFAAATLRVRGRAKGLGTGASILPLLPQAVQAFEDLRDVDGWGSFSNSSMWRTFHIAAKRVGVTGASPYSLRHSFATIAFDLTGDDYLVMALLQHAGIKTSQRYRLNATARVLKQKAEALGRHIGTTSQTPHEKTLENMSKSQRFAERVKQGWTGRKARIPLDNSTTRP